jgi:adenylate cyclase
LKRQAMKRLWYRISHLGVDKMARPSEVRFVVLVNTLAVVVSLFELSYVPLFISYLPGTQILLYLQVSIGILNLFTLLLNYYGYFLIARIYFGLLSIVVLNAMSLFLGSEFLVHFFLLESIVVAFFIYPAREKRLMYSVVLLYVLSFIGLEVWFASHAPVLKVEHNFFIIGKYSVIGGLIFLIVAISFYSYSIINSSEALLEEERQKSEDLLLNILPEVIAKRLKTCPELIADDFQEATVLFADICNFSGMTNTMSADELVNMLDEVFSEFDSIADRHALEKIKTIGDEYMVAGGIPVPRADHCEAVANMALEMQNVVHNTLSKKYDGLKLRIGIHSGPVVAGVIGKKKFSYDLWGDSVNTASRMELHCIEDKIQVTQEVYERLRDQYQLEYRGNIEIKGKDKISTYFLISRK